ncbi:MAG: class I SAM-dependent methyltransferase [Candidatus Eisenbacteria bacterium]
MTGRRTHDTVRIGGDYQYRALVEGHAVQRFWHYTKQLSIDRFLPPHRSDRVLDVGCGSGVISAFLAERAAEVLGLDGNGDAIAFARRQFQAPNLRFEHALVDEDFKIDTPIDKIYCLELIEHVYHAQAQRMLSHFRSILTGNGSVFITTPNYRSPWPIIEWLMDKMKIAPQMDEHQHVERYNRRRLVDLCGRAGFTVETIATTSFLAPWIAPLSWAWAEKVNEMETGCRTVPGCVIICVLRKDAA